MMCLRGNASLSLEVNGELDVYVDEVTTEEAAGVLNEDVVGVIKDEVVGIEAASRGDSVSSRFGPKNTAFRSALPSCGCSVN